MVVIELHRAVQGNALSGGRLQGRERQQCHHSRKAGNEDSAGHDPLSNVVW